MFSNLLCHFFHFFFKLCLPLFEFTPCALFAVVKKMRISVSPLSFSPSHSHSYCSPLSAFPPLLSSPPFCSFSPSHSSSLSPSFLLLSLSSLPPSFLLFISPFTLTHTHLFVLLVLVSLRVRVCSKIFVQRKGCSWHCCCSHSHPHLLCGREKRGGRRTGGEEWGGSGGEEKRERGREEDKEERDERDRR